MSLNGLLHRPHIKAVPLEHRANFLHLYFDVGWFGVLSGSAMAFLSVYLVRLGASPLHIGLVTAGPAMVTILFALPSGRWLQRRPMDRAVFWSSVLFRLFYLAWIPLPALFTSQTQIGLLIAITFLMSVPGTVLAVGFNALFADVVPPEWRGHVVGTRNAVLAVTFTTTSLACGVLLGRLPFPLGYQMVFALGAAGAALSSFHLHRVRINHPKSRTVSSGQGLGNLAHPGLMRSLGDYLRPAVGLRYLTRLTHPRRPSMRLLRGPFGPVLLTLTVFHLTQNLAIPLYPLYWVENLDLSDQAISLGNALFHSFVFLGSTQLARLTHRWGNHTMATAGAFLLAFYPLLTALSREIGMYLFTSIVGGLFAALSAGALGNYLLEKVPDEERPMHLAWYTLALNASILIASLTGPLLAQGIGLVPALVLSAGARLLSGLALWRWGR